MIRLLPTRKISVPREQFAATVARRLRGRHLVVVSNREPVVHMRRGDKVQTLTPASGLTTALVPVLSAAGGTWIAHGSGDADFDMTDRNDRLPVSVGPEPSHEFLLRRVRLEPDVERGYYYGYANEGLWPLCHVAYTPPNFTRDDWECYVAANRAFADAVLDEVKGRPAIVLLNDYHLALVPRLLREARADLLIGHFWHIPWPSRETMRVCPQLEEILHGLLGNDLFGLHIQYHCNNFLDTVDRGIEALVDWEYHLARRGRHRTFVRPFPISIDAEAFRQAALSRPFEDEFPELYQRVGDRIMLLGIDRLDYTKGIPNRLAMLRVLLETHPELIGRVVLVQIGAPSRAVIPRYRALAEEVAAMVSSINHQFGTGEWKPVEYVPEHHDRAAVAVLMRRADACLVTSLHDGMNLVAKEYVAARGDRPGTLLLSKFTGAARELPEACLVNPYDVDGAAALLHESLMMPHEQRAASMSRMFAHVRSNDIYRWSLDLLRELDEVARHSEARNFPGN